MSTHSKKSPRSNSSQATTASKENRAMPNVVPPTSSSPSFSECSNSSASPTQQQQPQQQRTYYWHASTPSTSPAYHYGPVVVEPYYWQQQQQQQQQHQHQSQEWSSSPPPPPPPTNVDVYQQMEALQTQVHEWRNNATSWQRHCEEINRAHEKETLKLKAKVNELIRQKSVLMERVRRYKTAVSSSSSPKSSSSTFSSKKEDPTPVTPITKQLPETVKQENNSSSPKEAARSAATKQPVSILRSPKRTGGSLASSRPRPLKKRRVRLDDAAPKQVRCISPRTVSSAPPMPVTPPMPQVKWAAF